MAEVLQLDKSSSRLGAGAGFRPPPNLLLHSCAASS
jgi:hypothetical protein